MTNKNKRLSGIFIVGCLLAVGVAVAAELASSGIFGSKHTICEGVKIGKVEVGGMTKAEAENAVDDHLQGCLAERLLSRSVRMSWKQILNHSECTFRKKS